MPASPFPASARFLVSAAALGLALAASSAQAQDYGGSYDNGPAYAPAPPEEVTVYGPHRGEERSGIGAPIENLSISRPVRTDDLDLRTEWGANTLRQRIVYTADRLCRELDAVYPDGFYPPTSDSPPCRRTAIEDAMDQADAAIARARGYGD